MADEIKRNTILRLRAVKKEQGLTISHIMEMLEKRNCYVSESTVKRLFSDNQDPLSFKYRDTIAPIADVLLDAYSDTSESSDVSALKAMIHDKNMMINILVVKNDELKQDYEKRISHLQKQIDKLDEHLMFRERMIEKKDDIIERLLRQIMKE